MILNADMCNYGDWKDLRDKCKLQDLPELESMYDKTDIDRWCTVHIDVFKSKKPQKKNGIDCTLCIGQNTPVKYHTGCGYCDRAGICQSHVYCTTCCTNNGDENKNG